MTTGWKVAIGITVAIVGFDLLLLGLRSITGGTPGGPTSSSYATAASGDAAYASLLARAGHPVERSRSAPGKSRLSPGDTVVLLDPDVVLPADAVALRSFVRSGGRLVAAPGDGSWLRRVVATAPVWRAQGVERAHSMQLGNVELAGKGSWSRLGGARPILAGAHVVATESTEGSGSAVLLADSSPLQNAYLGRADDAAFALSVAGPAQRRVVFLESYHGYGQSSGLAAVPGRWRNALLLLGLAVLIFMLARVRRFGPPEREARALPPRRAEYVEALAASLSRARDRQEALQPVRTEARRRVAARAGLGPEASDEAIAGAAARLGFPADEVAALIEPTRGGSELALGRALVRAGDA